MEKRNAFTLIELLVVIAIIALLMAILTPALSRAKDQAKKVVCTAHLKGLGVAFRMYVDDYDGKTHRAQNQGLWDNAWEGSPIVKDYGPNDDLAYWGIAYEPYAKNRKIFDCPSAIRPDDWPEKGWGVLFRDYFKNASYGLNSYVTNRKIDHAFKRQDEVIVFQDHIEQKLDSISSDTFCIGPGKSVNIPQWRPASEGGEGFVDTYWAGHDTVKECFRHGGTSMTCWMDGHVSDIRESTGEDVPTYWYTGERQETSM
jgi:prepilin-type N-terminal cleavage/methylation domain-containing protein/prepilin-type processing-associated H-X9-DG protein